MARQARLVVPGLAHYVLLRGHASRLLCVDEADRMALVLALKVAAQTHDVIIHALALQATEMHLLARPTRGPALGSMVQGLGRHYVAAFNRRHGLSGTLWDGRYRAAAIEAGEPTLQALMHIDGLSLNAQSEPAARGHRGDIGAAFLVDPNEIWALGNTPFEREAAYRARMHQPLGQRNRDVLMAAVCSSRAVGSAEFLTELATQLNRPVSPAPRGRPRRQTGPESMPK